MNNGFVILTVSQLNLYVRSLLEEDKKLKSVFLRGEISNFTNHYRSGHFYLSLKDENAIIKAVMFRGNAQKLLFTPQDGMKVIVTGRASLYDRDGQYQFYIDDMQPDGIGALHIAYEQLKEKLRLQGLFDEGHKKTLPEYPSRIGIVTSPTGAALQDILNILKRRWPLAQVILYPVLVQGQDAPAQICGAIRYLNETQACEVMIIGRGGGSLEELWAFNDESLARAIYDSHIPVISAVGHETDFTISDFVADMHAPTPSAAAELATPDRQAVAEYINSLRSNMMMQMKRNLYERKKRYEMTVSSKALKNPINIIGFQHMKLQSLSLRAASAEKIRLNNMQSSFHALMGKLDSLSPLKVLSRGYGISTHANGTVIKDITELNENAEFLLRLSGGTAECRALKIHYADKDSDGQINNPGVKQL